LKHELPDLTPALVISPHLDDAVLSCAQLIASRRDTMIVTILAGFPSGTHTGWSGRTTGLPIAKDANHQRREEDERASLVLGARTVWTDLLAGEYEFSTARSERSQAIEQAVAAAVEISAARSVFLPLGVTHPDHVAVSDAALLAVGESGVASFIYMDMPYGQARPDRVWRRLRRIRQQFTVRPVAPFSGDLAAKTEAVSAYSSQIGELRQGFGRHFNRVLTDPERYWCLGATR
jgi:LmbE family N-acetylglucosaminyl deacetylase